VKFVVTGCAGFIGSTLVDRLLSDGHVVIGVDNFSTGKRRFIESASKNAGFSLVNTDVTDMRSLTEAFKGGEFVFHLAANADVRFGTHHPHLDLEQNTIATFNVLEAMRANGIRRIAFSSTGSVYGEAKSIPTPEDAAFPVQTSLYGASKLAGEGLIAQSRGRVPLRSWRYLNVIMSLRVSVVLFETSGAVMNSITVEYSATGSTADMPSTGTITFMPRNAAPLAV